MISQRCSVTYKTFDVLGLNTARVYGQIPLLQDNDSSIFSTYIFDATSLKALGKIVPQGDFTGTMIHEDLNGKLSLWLLGCELFKLAPSEERGSKRTGCPCAGIPEFSKRQRFGAQNTIS